MIRLGVVGLRNIGLGHVRQAAHLTGVKVVAGADTDAVRCKEAEKEYGLSYTATDAKKLFADPDIDGVVLAVPNHLHAPLSIAALEAGKHVLVEKPVAGKSEDVCPMIEARDRTGKTVMVGMNQRFSPLQYALRDLLKRGEIGDVYLAKTFWNRRFPGEGVFGRGAWGFKKSQSGGGPLLDLGIHKLDLLLFLLGFPEVTSVSGVVTYGIGREACAARGIDYEVEDYGMGLIRFANGSALHLEASYFHNQPDEEHQAFFISGTQGVVRADGAALIDNGITTELDVPPVEKAPGSCVEHFCRVIRGEEALSSTLEQALTGLQIIEAIYQSSESGRPVDFSDNKKETAYERTV